MQIRYKVKLRPVIKIFLIIAFCMQFIVGCATNELADARPNDPAYAPVVNATAAPKAISAGSLYRPVIGLQLYGDRKAYRIGDIITVELNERTVASKSAETTIDKNADINIAEPTILGRTVDRFGHQFTTSVDQDRGFEGAGEADQENSLSGSIAVTVADVLPNGLLYIRGEKWMTLTTGDEFIRLSGLVRADDISSDNSVSSTKVADARISYSGTGDVANAAFQGWGSRFFNSKYWPF